VPPTVTPIDTPIPTEPPPPTPTEPPLPTPTPIQSINSLKLANPFGAGKRYLVNAFYGYHENESGNPIGFQTDLGGGQGTGHPGVDLVSLDYALESKRNNYVPTPNHRDLYAPASGVIDKEEELGGPDGHRISIVTQTIEGTVTTRLSHVDSSEGPPKGAYVQAGQSLHMSFKGQGHGLGSEYPHLHLEVYTDNEGSEIYRNPLPMLPSSPDSPDYAGDYWSYVDPEDKRYFTQLPGPGD
jgi:murein DD-endopeptidase MepM/ murein hydrolase activator NlpD